MKAKQPDSQYYEDIIKSKQQADWEYNMLTCIDTVLMKLEARLEAIEEVLGVKTVVTKEELNNREEMPGARLFMDIVERMGKMKELLDMMKQMFPTDEVTKQSTGTTA